MPQTAYNVITGQLEVCTCNDTAGPVTCPTHGMAFRGAQAAVLAEAEARGIAEGLAVRRHAFCERVFLAILPVMCTQHRDGPYGYSFAVTTAWKVADEAWEVELQRTEKK